MKNVIISAFILISGLCTAQENQLIHLENVNEQLRLTKWRTYTKDGKLKGSLQKTPCKLKVYSNAIKQKTSFVYIFEAKDATDDAKGFPGTVKNHHTAPSFFYNDAAEIANLYLDGYYYQLEIKDPSQPEKFEIEAIYVPKPLRDPNKKMTVKEKLAAAKAELKNMPMQEGDLPKNLAAVDHNKIISDYFMAMKPIQEKATASFTATEKEEIAKLKQVELDRNQKIKDVNNAYWASEEGQRKLKEMRGDKGKPSKYTVVNTTSTAVRIGGNGWSKSLNPGDKHEVNCNGDLYYKRLEGCCTWVDANLITKGSAACGKTINL